MTQTQKKIEAALVSAGLLNDSTGAKLVSGGIQGEDTLLAAWRAIVPEVGMRVERLHFNESWCWPVA
jgi:hypothetical protein